MFPKEPAVKSYFFGKGYKDLIATINASWTANSATAAPHWKNAESGDLLPRVFHFGAGLAVVLFGTALFLVISAVHALLLLLMFFAIYIAFTSLWLFERTWLALHGFFTVCPSCHSRKPLPAYVCTCGATHTRLIPSSYGILFRRCNCGNSLPSTFFLNRGKLISKCQDCGHFLSRAHTEARKVFVPTIGGPSAGKTAYLTWLISDLSERASKADLEMAFLESADKDAFDSRIAAMRTGQMPEKTVATTPSAFNVVFSSHGNPQRNLYLYDPAGEAYSGEAELIPHRFLDYCSGILFLVDPFSIAAVQKAYGVDPDMPGDLRPSRLRPDDLLDRLIFVLEKYFHLDAASSIAVPIAIVLTKVDAFDLETVLGKGGEVGTTIEEKLREWGMTPLVEVLGARFSHRRYFTCSAVGLGHSPGSAFQSERVSAPFDWLMSETAIELFAPDAKSSLRPGAGFHFSSVSKATVAIVVLLALVAAGLTWGLTNLFSGTRTPEQTVSTNASGTTPAQPNTLLSTPSPEIPNTAGTTHIPPANPLLGGSQLSPDSSTSQAATIEKPSFDCAAATKWAELQVCSNSTLAQQDQEISDLYKTERSRSDLYDENAVLTEQREWLRQRNACENQSDPAKCLQDIYQTRLDQLKSRTAWAASGGTTTPDASRGTTLVLNPDNSKNIWTTSVYSYAPGGGGPGGGLDNDQLRVGGWGDQYWSLIQFNLQNLPGHAKSAILKLYNGPGQATATPIDLYVIDESWGWQNGDRLWWRNRPTSMHKSASIPAPPVNGWISIDITDVYNNWQAGTQPNFGIALIPVSTNNAFDLFRSSKYSDETYRPRVEVMPD